MNYPKRCLNLISSILVIFFMSVSLVSCGDDEPDYQDVVGSWYGTRSYYNPVGGTKYQYLTVRFNADKTGSLEYEGPTSISIGYFTYSISGNTITCQGVWASSSGDVDSSFTFTLAIQGDRLIPTSLYTYFILTRDNSVMTDGNGNEVTNGGDSGSAGGGNNQDGGGSSGGSSGGSGGGNDSSSSVTLKDFITSGIGWVTSDSRYVFIFGKSGSVTYMETSTGHITLVASGSFSVYGNSITCNFSDVSWEGGSYKPNLFPGWTYGSSCVKTYTAQMMSSGALRITTPEGKTLTMTSY